MIPAPVQGCREVLGGPSPTEPGVPPGPGTQNLSPLRPPHSVSPGGPCSHTRSPAPTFSCRWGEPHPLGYGEDNARLPRVLGALEAPGVSFSSPESFCVDPGWSLSPRRWGGAGRRGSRSHSTPRRESQKTRQSASDLIFYLLQIRPPNKLEHP